MITIFNLMSSDTSNSTFSNHSDDNHSDENHSDENHLDNFNYYDNVEIISPELSNNSTLSRRLNSISLSSISIVTSDNNSNFSNDSNQSNNSNHSNHSYNSNHSNNDSDSDNYSDTIIEEINQSTENPTLNIETNNYNLKTFNSTSSTGSTKNPCRICYQTVDKPKRYCKCTGSIAYIHFDCLMEWLKTRRHEVSCEICHSKYFLEKKLKKKYFTKDNWDYVYYPFLLVNLIFIILFWVLIPSSFGFIFKMKENFTYVIFIALFNIAFIMFYWIKFSRKIVPRFDYKIVFNPRLEKKYDREIIENQSNNPRQIQIQRQTRNYNYSVV